MWPMQVGVAVRVHWEYAAATPTGATAYAITAEYPQYTRTAEFQVAVATAVPYYMRPTYLEESWCVGTELS